jgi:hypothetical protein
MYLIHKDKNRVERIKKQTFTDLGFRERDHLQEWIANDPSVLGEDILIIQKEFSGFSDTNERLDLLALDKQGNLVIIENKLDDSGRDVTWQALKYASYCSGLTKENVRTIYQDYLTRRGEAETAEERLSAFFDDAEYDELEINKGLSQRIILIAANFRREVTSTVLWLLNYRLRVQCFKVTPYTMGEQLLLNFEQIIPMRDAEEYVVRMAEKTKDDFETQNVAPRYSVRVKFWQQLIQEMNARTELFQHINPSKYSDLGAASGLGGVSFRFVITKRFARAEIYIDRKDKAENELVFDHLYARRGPLEEAFGETLEWERLEGKRACRIKAEKAANVFEQGQWPEMIAFMADRMVRFERVFKEPVREAGRNLKPTASTEF